MSSIGEPDLYIPKRFHLDLTIVISSWHTELCEILLKNSLKEAERYNIKPRVLKVPGALEIPVVVKAILPKTEAVVALGVVINGDTPHFKYVCENVCSSLSQLALESEKVVANGILTVNTETQAWERVGALNSLEDKGAQAIRAALSTAALLRRLK